MITVESAPKTIRNRIIKTMICRADCNPELVSVSHEVLVAMSGARLSPKDSSSCSRASRDINPRKRARKLGSCAFCSSEAFSNSRAIAESLRLSRSSLLRTFPGSTILPREARLRCDPLFLFLEVPNQLVELVITSVKKDFLGSVFLKLPVGVYDIVM